MRWVALSDSNFVREPARSTAHQGQLRVDAVEKSFREVGDRYRLELGFFAHALSGFRFPSEWRGKN